MKKILVVEDNENNMYLITYILENQGYSVIKALNGAEGVEKALNTSPDLILMDIQLPDFDGFEVTKRIRKSNNSIPIIALTSYAMVGDKEKALKSGFTGYVEKPINIDTIMDEIEKFF
ncbi:response regulator [Methanobacterium alkalithermotolerans]|uniref:Response regulator n=1 Tax=Methanobacterium alkalithermotolerans TaxID=2731220 RepID=A0A8T8K6C1_9EURY|nr:response regulator [Methanobacterium alkalithermotolerans]QUH24156.1 response regulator [Methanobacterium alkalithermotolerans]RJS49542.1 MAG: two-component system response regulator [Methanobacterium sp.]